MTCPEKAAVKKGLTADTARWICAVAESIGVSPGVLLRAVLQAAKHGVWLREEEWRMVAAVDKRRIVKIAELVARRVKEGYTVEEALADVNTAPAVGIRPIEAALRLAAAAREIAGRLIRR